MKVYLASDHAGFELKEKVKTYLKEKGSEFEDLGAFNLDKADDYPDYAYKAAKKVADSSSGAKAILFCGSAEGMCIVANKVKGIRAVSVSTLVNARVSREHNDANVLCLSGGGTLSPIPGLSLEDAKNIIETWLSTPVSGAGRHARRLKKISGIENLWQK